MARTALSATTLTEAGIDPGDVDTAAELTDGNSFVWAAHRLLYVLNGDDAALTVTIPTPVTVGRGSLAVADTTITIPAGEYRLAGPFGQEHRQADGTVHVNYAGTTPTGVMVAVLDA
ncbi:hypothetical protein HS041_22410 [Planomonospora sp. ID67723]|uniref:hypothetical protein n=1 Tax=Planomonospora sp. ID67723 TaxID=2738134 RepID=UPI0018C4309C|nr:hypothetical protein [Planomonospora sp. ID67723]MBG0830518.1 hypothetical protein [Planomonospora sp. ID67723]